MKFFGSLVSLVAGQNLLEMNWDALANQRGESQSTCAARVNRRVKYLDMEIYHTCMMDTDLYLEEYNPNGTSKFSIEKINHLVSLFGDDANDLVFGWPEPDCGCFPGCDDFTVRDNHLIGFCCSDWESVCVDPPTALIAMMEAETEAKNYFQMIEDKSPLRKLKRFLTKLKRNINQDGNVSCNRVDSVPAAIVNPVASHPLSDKLWHIVDFYFMGCSLDRHHMNRLNRFANAVIKTENKVMQRSLKKRNRG